MEQTGELGARARLAITNALAKERVDEPIKWVRDNLSITHVIPMRTFQVLTV